jgi:Tfp pilus assembly protein PilX
MSREETLLQSEEHDVAPRPQPRGFWLEVGLWVIIVLAVIIGIATKHFPSATSQ